MLDELRRMDFLPRGRREKVRDLDKVIRELEHKNGRSPSPEELAETMGISADEVDDILMQAKSCAETSIDEGADGQLASLLTDPSCGSPSGSAEWAETREKLAEVIMQLPEQEKTVITLYYAEELLLKEISDILGVTESRVSQIHSRALFRLNQKLSEVIEAP
ncbi:MAG: RNA polymerase sigma factor for flagellar operon FliA [Candidatus Paceibacteria bacterium]